MPLSVSNDHVGPMARSAFDAALLLQGMAGYDREDAHAVDLPVPDFAAESASLKPVRLGLPRAHFFHDVSPEIAAAVEKAVAALADVTLRRAMVEIPAHLDTTAFRADIYAVHRDATRRSPDLFQPDTLQRIQAGADIDKGAHRDARKKLDELRSAAGKIFDQVDLVVTPTTPIPPFDATRERTPEQLRGVEVLTLRNTRPFNALGLPAISVPCGFTESGLPIGLQIVGPPGGESRVLALARAFQARTDWHRRRPPT
jgi:Asp-tRNA(Asn)/Glu-tRNA(Gln) amidotransferase A subunit family amidase